MVEVSKKETSSLSRLFSDSNFAENQLTSNTKTIWNGYLLDAMSEIPRVKVPQERTEPTDIEPGKEGTNPVSSIHSVANFKLQNAVSLRGKLGGGSREAYSRKFLAVNSFHGYVTVGEGIKFTAELSDTDSQRYEFQFEKEELPQNQRAALRIGSPIVVHVGHSYENGTKRRSIKLFLTDERGRDSFRNKIIEKKLERWTF